jgi:hypothetical protein
MPEEKFKRKNDQAKYEHENTDAVNAMHVFYKPGFWTAGIRFFNVEIFCYLPKYTHKKLHRKDTVSLLKKFILRRRTAANFIMLLVYNTSQIETFR